MLYIIPQLQDMLDGINSVRVEYIKKCEETGTTPNPERENLIDILEATASLIQDLQLSSYMKDDLELRETCLSAYLFCLEQINSHYRYLNPEHSVGYIYNSGSKLYKILSKILLEKLKISDENKLSEQENLIYISGFYHQVFHKYGNIFVGKLKEKKCEKTQVEKTVKDTIMSVAYHVIDDVNRLMKAIPTETAIDFKMETMPDDYLQRVKDGNKKVNSERELLAKIGAAISELNPINLYVEDKKNFLTESQRIKMGFLLTIMQTVWDSYYIKANVEKSILYCLCREALNITKIDDMDPALRVECLSAYKSYINGNGVINNIEIKVNEFLEEGKDADHIHAIMGKINDRTNTMIQELNQTDSSSFTPFRITMGLIGALILAAPGYGAGYALSYVATRTSTAVLPKLALNEHVMRPMMEFALNKNGTHLSYFAADLIVDATLIRELTKTCEMLGMLMGGAAGVGLALMIEITYESLSSLTSLYTHLSKNPLLAKSADPRFVDCLVNMPSEIGIITHEQKEKVQTITKSPGQAGIFGHQKHGKDQIRYDLTSLDDERYDSLTSLKVSL